MKTFKNIHSVAMMLTAFVMTLSLSSCGGGDDASPQDEARRKLMNTWTVERVMVDNIDRTDMYTGLQVTFAELTLTASSGKGAWRTSDTWQFANDEGTSIIRGDDVTMNITQLTDNALTLTFTWTKTTYGEGRTDGIAGAHEFTFKR